MGKMYRFVAHTADVEFIAYGRTLDELFSNSFMALFDTMAYAKKLSRAKSTTQRITIREKARTLEELLWYVLQDAVSLMDSKVLFGYKVEGIHVLERNGGCGLKAVIAAKRQRPEYAKLDVKGISRFDMKVKKEGGRLMASVVLDV